MRVVSDIAALRAARAGLAPLGFVPTMGSLHEGHLSLVRLARRRARAVAVSIFVNRLQFQPADDFERYPRALERDCELLAAEGVDLVFAPDERVLYPVPQAFLVQPPPMAEELEGRFRPGFFRGVATVVLKLLNCVLPAVAVFGKKDYQQLVLVQEMVRQLNLPVEIAPGDTVREPDGLAMSSRNVYLAPAERNEAPRLHRVLQAVSEAGLSPNGAMAELKKSGWEPDYVEVRRRGDLAPPQENDRQRVVLGAARLGGTRLVDAVEF